MGKLQDVLEKKYDTATADEIQIAASLDEILAKCTRITR
jgi:hypothetical protein